MAKSLSALMLGLLGLLVSTGAAEQCGDASYDPAIYVCHNNQFLCPVINGEGLGYCNGACYSRFMYQCVGSALALLPQLEPGTAFSLVVSNPALPALHDQPVAACGQHWFLGGATCTYCPDVVGAACPPGNSTAMVAPGGMHTMVPGGQQFYLDPYWNVAYTQAHSAYIPTGSTLGGLVAYAGGGFVNMNPTASGWVACPPRASGGGGRWNLVARNDSTAPNLNDCTGVNLAVRLVTTGGASAWQYT